MPQTINSKFSDGPPYESAEFDARHTNIENVLDNPLSRKDSVRKDAERLGVSFEVLWHEFRTNQVFAAKYAKDPVKQTIHQKVAADWTRSLPFVSNFSSLPSSGPNALYLQRGRLVFKPDLYQGSQSKSIDFKWQVNSTPIFEIYATHKFTRNTGGSQDNQFNDLKSFAEHAKEYSPKRDEFRRFLLLCDGPYYQLPFEGFSSKIEYLNNFCAGNPYVIAMSTNLLPRFIASLIEETTPRKQLSEAQINELNRLYS